MTTNIDWGRKLFGKPKADKAARLRHGVTASASSEGYVDVLLDGSEEPVTLACSGSFDAGQSVYVVNDGGSYAIMGDSGSNAPDSIEETDPTVPEWAKQPNPPTYTAEDVGALPDTTVIPTVPTKLSELENDRGYLTEIPSHTHDYLPLSGGTLTGNLSGKYITGTWLQTTGTTNLRATPSQIAVLSSGWVYYRTPAEILSDIGAAPKYTYGTSDLTAGSSTLATGTLYLVYE
jgi:hypothetical protein